MLTRPAVVARNFGEETLQGAYEVIQHKTPLCPASCSPLPSTFRPGAHRQRCPAWQEGRLMGFWPGAAGGAQPDCDLHHCGVRAGTAVLHHGLWALQSAACLEAGHHIRPGNRHIRHPGHGASPWINRSLPKARRAPLYPGRPGLRAHRGVVPDLSLPAVAAHITCNADLGITEVAYIRCGWSRSESGSHSRCKNAGYYGHTVVCCVLTRRKGGKEL